MMITYELSNKNQSKTNKEKIEIIDNIPKAQVGDLLRVLREFEEYPKEYDKEVILALKNKLFEFGITCI